MKREIIQKIADNRYLWFYEADGNIRYGYAESAEQARTDLSKSKERHSLILDDWFPVFLTRENLKETIKESTEEKYKQLYKSFISPSLGRKSLPSITAGDLEEMINRMIEEGRSGGSISATKTLMNRILESAVSGSLITVNPMKVAELPKSRKKQVERYPFPEDALKEMFRQLDEKSAWSGGSTLLAVRIAAWTGMRVGEVLGLQWEDIDMEKSIIHVRNNLTYSKKRYVLTTLKTDKSRRIIPLSAEHMEELRSWKKNERRMALSEKAPSEFKNLVFLSRCSMPVNAGVVSRAVHKEVVAMKKSGLLDPEKDYSFHSLRHTFATKGVQKDMQPKVLSTLMGHSSIRITMDIYAHVGEQMMRDEMERCGMM